MLATTIVLAVSLQSTPASIFTLDAPHGGGSRDFIPTPDLDGDGLDDFTVVVSGRLLSYSSATRATLRDVTGASLSGHFTRWIGDANGDGAPDLLALKSLNPYTVVVRDGMTGAEIYTVVPTGTLEVGGINPAFGPIGDVDGDGQGDFWLRIQISQSAYEACDVHSSAGGGLIRRISRTGSYGFARRVREYPDSNGDGIAEIAIGDTTNFGSSPLYRGRLLVVDPTTGADLFEVLGSSTTRLGEEFEVIGDVDRDGSNDFMVHRNGFGSPDRELGWIYSAATGAFLFEVESPLPGDSTLGRIATDVGDVNDDGHDDFLLGDVEQGAAFVYSGASGAVLWQFQGTPGSGRGVQSVGDIDGDGSPDWVVLSWTSPDDPGSWRASGFGVERPEGYLEFELAGDGATPIANGQELSSNLPFGPLVRISTSGPGQHGAAAFDTNPNGPNTNTTAPGLLVGSGNAVVIQGRMAQSSPGIFDTPEPAASGGTLTFELLARVQPEAIDLIGVDAGSSATVALRDVRGYARTFTVPAQFTANGAVDLSQARWTLRLNTLDPQPGFAATATAIEHPQFDITRLAALSVEFTGPSAVDRLWLLEAAPPINGAYKVTRAPAIEGYIRHATGLNDVDGDGVRDYATSNWALVQSQSAVTVYSGRTQALLHTSPVILATDVANIGDVNGNGVDDILIGSGDWGLPSTPRTGIAYVHDGATGNRIYRIEGTVVSDRLGDSVAALDDVDGDGVLDFAIGTSPNFTPNGKVLLYSGASGSLLRELAGIPTEITQGAFALVEDLDGDGVRDVAIISHDSPPTSTPTRHVRIYSPVTGAVLVERTDTNNSEGLGPVPFLFNDVDLDGIRDILLGVGNRDIAEATVISGATCETLIQLPPTASFVPNGSRHSIAIADMNGDGILDICQQYFGSRVRVLCGATFEVLFDASDDTSLYSTSGLYSVGDLDRDGLDDLIATAPASDPTVTFVGFTPSVGIVCTGAPHSAGLGARLRPMGSTSIAANDFTLEAWNLPPTSFALLLNSSGTAPAIGPGSVALMSDGHLCLAPASLARHQVLFTVSGGMTEMPLDLTHLPTAGVPGFMAPATAGETRYFQCWFRDNAGTFGSNLSDAIAVTFTH